MPTLIVVVFCPCGIVMELSPEMDIVNGSDEDPPEDDVLEEKPPEEDDEVENKSPEEDDDVVEEKPPEEDDEVEEKPPEDDELLEELEEDDGELMQSAKPKQFAGFVGQHPFIQQSEPHCIYAQPVGPSLGHISYPSDH